MLASPDTISVAVPLPPYTLEFAPPAGTFVEPVAATAALPDTVAVASPRKLRQQAVLF